MATNGTNSFGIRDNHAHGKVADFLVETYRGEPLQHAHLFLNEARLSALGLAIYLAGRLALVQQAPGDAPNYWCWTMC